MNNYGRFDEGSRQRIKEGLENASKPQNTSSPLCIYSTPKLLRNVNKAAYTPRFVSIGPYHYENEDLHMMENVKYRYLKKYLDRTQRELEDILSNIEECKEELKSHYAEITLSDTYFIEMMLLDGVFIIELFLRMFDPDLDKRGDLISDLFFMQENQLPWVFIEELYNKDVIQHVPYGIPFLDLAFSICSRHVPSPFPWRCPDINMIRGLGVKHLHDLLRKTIIHPFPSHIIHPPQSHIIHPPQSDASRPPSAQRRLSATVLHEAGVEFKILESKSFLDIKFDKRKGVLYMPSFIFDRNTETFVRNLMAYEQQCPYQDYTSHTYLCDYFYLMDTLITTWKDVDLLANSKIITNWLGDNNKVAALVNNLSKHVQIDANLFYYAQLCEDLNEHCNISWNNWKTTFRRDYLSTPWKVASTIAAIILLSLTLIQTVCSLISVIK